MIVHAKYLGPTNTRGARLTARSDGYKTVTISYPYEADYDARWAAILNAFLGGNKLPRGSFMQHGAADGCYFSRGGYTID